VFLTVLLVSDRGNDNLSRNDSIINPVIATSKAIERRMEARQFLYPSFPKREKRSLQIILYISCKLQGILNLEFFNLSLGRMAKNNTKLSFFHGVSPPS